MKSKRGLFPLKRRGFGLTMLSAPSWPWGRIASKIRYDEIPQLATRLIADDAPSDTLTTTHDWAGIAALRRYQPHARDPM